MSGGYRRKCPIFWPLALACILLCGAIAVAALIWQRYGPEANRVENERLAELTRQSGELRNLLKLPPCEARKYLESGLR